MHPGSSKPPSHELYPEKFALVYGHDPELADGFLRVFSGKFPVEIRMDSANGPKVGIEQKLLFHLYRREEYSKSIILKLVLLSDLDLFFHYTVVISMENFEQLKDRNSLELDIEQFSQKLIALFNNIQNEPGAYFLSLTFADESRAQLEIFQQTYYKAVQVLTITLYYAEKDQVKQTLMYRYDLLVAKSQFLTSRLADVTEFLKVKNPNLLKAMFKNLGIK